MVPRFIFCWWSPFTVSPPCNTLSLFKHGVGAVQRQHWAITDMPESTNVHGLSKSFENSTYSYASHTIATLSKSSLCYPWSPSYHVSNHITVYRIFTTHMLYFIIIFQAICCSFILSMCPNHHRTLWSTLLVDSLSISALLLTCPFLCLCRL